MINQSILMQGTLAFGVSLLFSFYIVPFFRAVALRFNILDAPDGRIKVHKKPTPYLGGLAVYCGLLCGLVVTFPVTGNWLLFLIGITLLLFLGLVDDLTPLAPYQKFGGQLLVAFCFLRSGIYMKEHFFYNSENMAISVLWILTIVNGFNLIDVMDGLATTTALGATSSFMVISIALQQYDITLLLCAFLGSLFAFLYYNKPQASIYLGDAGSLFIGGFLATVPFFLKWGTYNIYGYLTPIIILAIPIAEVVSLIIIRTYKKIPFYRGSPDHFCHYLQKNGWSRQGILWYVGSTSMVLALVGYGHFSNFLSLSHLFIALSTLFVGWVYLLCKKI